MKPQLILESVIWAFVIMLVAPVVGSSIMMLNTNPISTLALLYLIATVYYWKHRPARVISEEVRIKTG